MFSIEAPSFCACLTLEFINTVQRLPRSTGLVGKQAELGKLLDIVAQRLGKGLQKAAAAGGAGLVQEDVV